ncbi:MAG: zinc ribbon domain-containing protein [Erysipelotrichaceae bacterium]|jgi:cation transport ATPase|nr:zinc ribbon domain-containing protein [Erysipelotrichaceae bacterium]
MVQKCAFCGAKIRKNNEDCPYCGASKQLLSTDTTFKVIIDTTEESYFRDYYTAFGYEITRKETVTTKSICLEVKPCIELISNDEVKALRDEYHSFKQDYERQSYRKVFPALVIACIFIVLGFLLSILAIIIHVTMMFTFEQLVSTYLVGPVLIILGLLGVLIVGLTKRERNVIMHQELTRIQEQSKNIINDLKERSKNHE